MNENMLMSKSSAQAITRKKKLRHAMVERVFIDKHIEHLCSKGAFFSITILILLMLLGFRFKHWSDNAVKVEAQCLAASADESQADGDLPFPKFSICNANPILGSRLFGYGINTLKGVKLYEQFSDARQGRALTSKSWKFSNDNLYKMLNESSHDLSRMLVACRIGSKLCSHNNFSKSILPSGSCFTYVGEISASQIIHIEINPNMMEYIIPNNGLVGIRFLIHETEKPQWLHLQNSVFLGTQFHTMLRLKSTKKMFAHQCVHKLQWNGCIQDCLQRNIHQYCGCFFKDDGCNLQSIANCTVPIEIIQDTISLSSCNCIRPCESISYAHESILQAWRPSFPSFWRTHSSRTLDEPGNKIKREHDDKAFSSKTSLNQLKNIGHNTNIYSSSDNEEKVASSIQLWAFLREIDRPVFNELSRLELPFSSLCRISEAMQHTVQKIEMAATFSRSRTRHTSIWYRNSPGRWGQIFDENCLDQAEHIGMLDSVSDLSKKFIRRLKTSFLFFFNSTDTGSVQLNLITIFIQRTTNDFKDLLTELSINDLIADVTMLDLRRKEQKCIDSAYTGNAMLNNITRQITFPSNSTVSSTNENVISSLQTMLLAIDSNLRQLSDEFAELYKRNPSLVHNLRSLVPYQSSIEQRYSRASVSVQLTSPRIHSLRFRLAQCDFNRNVELLDILTSILMISSLLLLLGDGIVSTISKWMRDRKPEHYNDENFQCALTVQPSNKFGCAGNNSKLFPSSLLNIRKLDSTRVHFDYSAPDNVQFPVNQPPSTSSNIPKVCSIETRLPKKPPMNQSRISVPALLSADYTTVKDASSRLMAPFLLQQMKCEPIAEDQNDHISTSERPTFT